MSTAVIVLATFSVMLIGLGCSGGLSEQEVRRIVKEHSVPGPKGEPGDVGPQGPKGSGAMRGHKAPEVTVAM